MDVSDTLASELISVMEEMANAARRVTLRHFRSDGLVADNKANETWFDPVTAADRDAEQAMRQILAARRPEDGILGEEMGAVPGTTGLTWVLDPIDGTRAFMSGLPTWGVLIALDAGDGPIAGLIDQPFTAETFFGGFGKAEYRRNGADGQPLSTRPCPALEAATLYTTFPEIGTVAERQAFELVRDRARLTRYGCDCYAYALVALGQIDLVIEAGLNPYDIQAPISVIEGAGGIVTDWQGRPAHRGGRAVAAGDARVHAQALEILSQVPD